MKCPYCDQPIESGNTVRVALTPKQRQVYDYVVISGIDGASIDTIMSDLSIKSHTTLRTRVHDINKRIAPLEIIARGKSYRIERIEVITDGKDQDKDNETSESQEHQNTEAT